MKLARSLAPEVEFSAEDASRTDYGYLREVLQAVFEAGATTLNVPDTVGYSLPHEYGEMVARLVRDIPGAIISVHCHNDLGLAVANSLAAVKAGARQIECTINGIGERAGNTALEEVVMALKVRGADYGVETGVKTELLAPSSAMLSGVTGVWPQPNKAIVGRNAFAHEAGIHQHGVLANPLCYEIMTPASVGVRETQMVLGKHTGKHAVESRLLALGLAPKADELEAITAKVKALADQKKFVYATTSWPSPTTRRSGAPAWCATRWCRAATCCPPPPSKWRSRARSGRPRRWATDRSTPRCGRPTPPSASSSSSSKCTHGPLPRARNRSPRSS